MVLEVSELSRGLFPQYIHLNQSAQLAGEYPDTIHMLSKGNHRCMYVWMCRKRCLMRMHHSHKDPTVKAIPSENALNGELLWSSGKRLSGQRAFYKSIHQCHANMPWMCGHFHAAISQNNIRKVHRICGHTSKNFTCTSVISKNMIKVCKYIREAGGEGFLNYSQKVGRVNISSKIISGENNTNNSLRLMPKGVSILSWCQKASAF